MFLNNLMNARNLTRAELSASSHIPESTLRDILNGKALCSRNSVQPRVCAGCQC